MEAVHKHETGPSGWHTYTPEQLDEVRRELIVGGLRPHDPLPSVRELASQLVVNPRTVRQAYGELEREAQADADGLDRRS